MRRVFTVVLILFVPLVMLPAQAGAMPLIEDAYAVPSVLGPAGGTVTVLGWQTSWGPATCQIRFDKSSLPKQDAPLLAYSRAPRPCQNTVVARVTIGALPSGSSQALSFALIVRNVYGSMAKPFSVSVESERSWADNGEVVHSRTSTNWTGYVLRGGPYTAVTGTFQLPLIYSSSGCRETYAEWVGVDGVGSRELLQAGISEEMSNVWSVCTRRPQAWAWWEEVPGPAAPFVTLAVRPGQSVTVTIAQVFAGWWYVGVFNDSTGQRIGAQSPYNGPRSSAEWVVEASSSTLCSPGRRFGGYSVCEMAAFAGRAHFSQLDAVGPTRQMIDVNLVQHDLHVASPSPVWSISRLLAQGFDVSYSGLDGPVHVHLRPTGAVMEQGRAIGGPRHRYAASRR
jgi:Peptidase A4 family